MDVRPPKDPQAWGPSKAYASCIGAASYQLSKHIDSLISPLAGKTDSHVKNSKHFVEVMAGLRVEEDEMLISFDVTSLFTNVSIDEAVQVIYDKLQGDKTLADRATLSPDRVAELLEACLSSTYFSYGGCSDGFSRLCCCGEPVHGVLWRTGTQVCPSKATTLDEICWWHLLYREEGHSERAPRPPQQCKTLHQVYCGGGEGWWPALSRHPAPEERGWRPGCHRLQEAHTHWLIPGLPIAPSIPCQEGTGQVPVWHSKEHHHQAGGQLAEERVSPHQSPEAERLPQCLHPLFISTFFSWPGCGDHWGITTEGGRRPLLVMLPYTEGVSDDIRRVCRKFGMKVVFKSGRSLCSMLTKVKNALSMEKMSKVLYQVPYSCGKAYVGETVRWLETRMKEHRDACQKGNWRSQRLQSMHGRTITQSSGMRPQWVIRLGPPRSCCWRRQFTSGCSNPPSTGMWDWSCLDAGWQPWEHGSRGDPPLPLVHSHVTSGVNDVTHGYKWQVLTLAPYVCPEENQSIWSKRQQSFNPAFKAGIGEVPLAHDQASWEDLTSRWQEVCESKCVGGRYTGII